MIFDSTESEKIKQLFDKYALRWKVQSTDLKTHTVKFIVQLALLSNTEFLEKINYEKLEFYDSSSKNYNVFKVKVNSVGDEAKILFKKISLLNDVKNLLVYDNNKDKEMPLYFKNLVLMILKMV